MFKRNKRFGSLIKFLLPKALEAIEKATEESIEAGELSTNKKGTARLERAATILASMVDIPFLPEAFEVMLFKAVIATTVELLRLAFGRRKWYQGLKDIINGRKLRIDDKPASSHPLQDK